MPWLSAITLDAQPTAPAFLEQGQHCQLYRAVEMCYSLTETRIETSFAKESADDHRVAQSLHSCRPVLQENMHEPRSIIASHAAVLLQHLHHIIHMPLVSPILPNSVENPACICTSPRQSSTTLCPFAAVGTNSPNIHAANLRAGNRRQAQSFQNAWQSCPLIKNSKPFVDVVVWSRRIS